MTLPRGLWSILATLSVPAMLTLLPSAVLILMTSPSLMNSGTWTTSPVSSLAGFWTFEAVSPFTPSADSITLRATVEGSSTVSGFSSTNNTSTLPPAVR